jgi:GxxExxY protein
MIEPALSQAILDAFFRVYTELGYGFLESVYANALVVELQANGIACRRQLPFEVVYRGAVVGLYRCDLIVADRVLIEVKAIRVLSEADERQTRNYLKTTKIEVGFLLNFGPKPVFRRFVYSDLQKQRS